MDVKIQSIMLSKKGSYSNKDALQIVITKIFFISAFINSVKDMTMF